MGSTLLALVRFDPETCVRLACSPPEGEAGANTGHLRCVTTVARWVLQHTGQSRDRLPVQGSSPGARKPSVRDEHDSLLASCRAYS